MNDNERYIRDAIHTWVWGGYLDAATVREQVADIMEIDVDAAAMDAAIAEEFAAKQAAERDWPRDTDCDRLDRVFAALQDEGICALQNTGYTMSDGHEDVAAALHDAPPGTYRGYCFFHGQDLERAVAGRGLMLAFGDLDDVPVQKLAIGEEVRAAFEAAGFTVAWNGSAESRIDLPAIDWKRRGAPGVGMASAIAADLPEVSAPRRPWWKFW